MPGTLAEKLPSLPRRSPDLIPYSVLSQDTFSAYKTPVKEEQTFYKINKNHLVSKLREEKEPAKFRISWTAVSMLPSAVLKKNVISFQPILVLFSA